MTEFDSLGQYPILQLLGALIVFATGVYAVVRGVLDKRRANRTPPPPTNNDAKEVARLRDERQQERDRRMADDIVQVREDFEIVVKAMKESIDTRFHDVGEELSSIDRRVRETETSVAVINDRQGRPGPRR